MSLNHFHPKKSEHKLLMLTGIYVFCILLAEILGIKTIPLGISNISLGPIFIRELKVSVAIFLLPLIFSMNDIIIEVYGKKTAKTVYHSGLGCIVGLIGFSMLATWLPASQLFSASEADYDQIFHQTTRIAIASIIAFAISDILDILIFARLRERIKNLGLRSNISNILAQFIDTATFLYLAFFTATFWHAIIWGIILPYWILKETRKNRGNVQKRVVLGRQIFDERAYGYVSDGGKNVRIALNGNSMQGSFGDVKFFRISLSAICQ